MSNVDPTVPVQGKPTTQSVRDNFSTIKTELEAFQSTSTTSDGAALLGYKHGGSTGTFSTGAVATTQDEHNDREKWVEDYGAVGDNSTDDTSAIQAALDDLSNGETLQLTGGKTYLVTSELVFPASRLSCVLEGNGATIRCNHNGNGLVITCTNENFASHRLSNFTLTGPNVSFPASAAQLAGTSTGSGLLIGRTTGGTNAGVRHEFYNVYANNFNKGIYLRNVLSCKFFGGGAFFNQYGIYVDGGATNANDFYGISIRQNRVFGLYSVLPGAGPYASQNRFFGGIFETNIPYDTSTWVGGYPTSADTSGTVGVAVKLVGHDQDWGFNDVYFENHNFSFWMYWVNGSKFNGCRLADGTNRLGGIYLDTLNSNNTFNECIYPGTDSSQNVTINNQSQFGNNFNNCIGLVFDTANLGVENYIRHARRNNGLIGTLREDGIKFQDAGGSGTPTSNALSQYEVGTWTPAVNSSGGGSVTLSTATGRYARVGQQVTLWFHIVASVNLSDANYYDVSGIPFTPLDSEFVGTARSATNAGNANQWTIFGVESINSGAKLRVHVNPAADFSNSDSFSGMVVYRV